MRPWNDHIWWTKAFLVFAAVFQIITLVILVIGYLGK